MYDVHCTCIFRSSIDSKIAYLFINLTEFIHNLHYYVAVDQIKASTNDNKCQVINQNHS